MSSFQEVEGSESGMSALGSRLSYEGFYSGIRLSSQRAQQTLESGMYADFKVLDQELKLRYQHWAKRWSLILGNKA